jgi:Fur family peroxide stress response transcriptional regulator
MSEPTTNRQTKQRLAILNYLHSNFTHPSAETIYQNLQKTMPNLGLATVYRNLNLLSQQKDILCVEGLDGKMHFDGHKHNHVHFICRKCQKIFDLDSKKIPQFKIQKPIKKIEEVKCTLYGICSQCHN